MANGEPRRGPGGFEEESSVTKDVAEFAPPAVMRHRDSNQIDRSRDFARVLGQADDVNGVTSGAQRADLAFDAGVAAIGQIADNQRPPGRRCGGDPRDRNLHSRALRRGDPRRAFLISR
jgi:hypothetical protein